MLATHPVALRADLDDHGIDLLDLWREGGASGWKIATHAAMLPPGSRVHRAAETDLAWTTEGHLLAAVIDAVQYGSYVTHASAGGKSSPPAPYLRPTQQAAQHAADLSRELKQQARQDRAVEQARERRRRMGVAS